MNNVEWWDAWIWGFNAGAIPTAFLCVALHKRQLRKAIRLAERRSANVEAAVMTETDRCAQIVRSCVGTDCDFETAAQLILNRNFK